MPRAPTLKHPRTRAALAMLITCGPTSRQEIERGLGLPRKALYRAFDALSANGFIQLTGHRTRNTSGRKAHVYEALRPVSDLPVKATKKQLRAATRVPMPDKVASVKDKPRNREIERHEIEAQVRAFQENGRQVTRLPAPREHFRPLSALPDTSQRRAL